MGDLTSRRLIVLKGLLFLIIAVMGAGLVVIYEDWRWEIPALAMCIWASCRFYYFLFYVLERYVGIEGRYAGLWDLLTRLRRRG